MEKQKNEVKAFTASCYSGEAAPCSFACPFRIDLRAFLSKAARGQWAAAYKELRNATVFPTVACVVCDHPCETYCQRSTLMNESPVAISAIERACLREARKKAPPAYAIPPKEERIAVIGAGPAGLAFALTMAQKNYPVTVYDRQEAWGGALRTHPQFAEMEEDIKLQFSTAKLEFRFGTEITSLDEVGEAKVIFVATGREGNTFGVSADTANEYCVGVPPVFLGGECAGLSLVEGMALAVHSVKAVEAWIQTGRAEYTSIPWNRDNCKRVIPLADVEPTAPVVPEGDEFTGKEAQQEAMRCARCDCDYCMSGCELLEKYKKKPPRIAEDVYLDTQGRDETSTAVITRQVWSCNLCGRCGNRCPEGADLAEVFHYSRVERIEGIHPYPEALHHYWLREMDYASDESGYAGTGSETNYAFFPGCRLSGSDPETVKAAYTYLKDKHGAGLMLGCCGAPGWWAGDRKALKENTDRLRDSWESLGKPTLVLACASCSKMFERIMPEVKTVSIYELMAADGLKADSAMFGTAAIFDPCAANGKDGWKDAVRSLAAASGVQVSDFDSDGKCCGFGGHMHLANGELYDQITAARAEAAEEPYIVYCSNCREVFESKGKENAHILNVVLGTPSVSVPTLEKRRENMLSLKRDLMKEYWNETFEPEVQPWDELDVDIPADVQSRMERQLVTLRDVREAIWKAEQSGEGFVDDSGSILCRLAGTVVTYWVQYKVDGSKYMVEDAYSHRMRIREED